MNAYLTSRKKKFFLSLCSSSLLCFGLGQSAFAEDIEIYQAVFNANSNFEDAATNDPNVLFILDNSLSMSAYRLIQEDETPTAGPYDPTVTYGSGSSRDNNVYLYNTDMVYVGIRINTSQNVCKAATDAFVANPSLPIHQDKFIQWASYSRNTYGWTVNYLQSNDNNHVFECEEDNGVHGRTNGARDKYPRVCSLGTGLCSSNNGRALYRNRQQFVSNAEWPYAFFSDEMIMVDGNYHAYLNDGVTYDEARVSNCSYNDEILVDSSTGVAFRCLQKFEIMKRALEQALLSDPDDPDGVDFSQINLGLMRFNYNTGSGNSGATVIDAVAVSQAPTAPDWDDDDRTNRDDFLDKLKSMQFEGNTPLAESMYEAYRYFAGWAPYSAEHTPRTSNQLVLDPEAVIDGFVGNSVTDETYLSPVTSNQCQGNYVVLLSDGVPTSDNTYDSLIRSLPNVPSCGDNCVDEMATALKANLGVHTFTIGFDIDIDLLKDTARNGSPNSNPVDGDGYYTADNLDSLKSVFSRVLGQVQAIEADSFVAPAVTVNAFNRLQNREDIYYAVFKPRADLRWPGNVKKYKVSSDAQILDSSGINAISPDTGFFTDASQSYWSDEADGAIVTDGGFAAELLAPRNLFGSLDSVANSVTRLSSTSIELATERFLGLLEEKSLLGSLLGLSQNQFDALGSQAEGNVEEIARWSLGQKLPIDPSNPSATNMYIAESIHSTPFVLSYGSSRAAPKDVVFLVTNQGLLHAITGQGGDEPDGLSGEVGGSERWSYLPDPSLLQNLGGYYNKKLGDSIEHLYGLDGEMSALVERNVANELTKAHLFLTQRRGGKQIFAVDVTNGYDRTNPIGKLWTIKGGSGDLKRLAYTWSKPAVSKFPVCTGSMCEVKDAIVVGGGYDTDYDNNTISLNNLADGRKGQDTTGNALYVLDAATGAVLWSAAPSAVRGNTTASSGL